VAGEVTLSDVNGLIKKVYDNSGLHNALPGSSILQRRIPYGEGGATKVSEGYQVGIVVRPPNGFTYSGSGGGVTQLKAPRNMVIKSATIAPFELELREQFAWAALSRAAEEGAASMGSLAGEGMKAMKFSTANRLELQILNGQRPIGIVESVADVTAGSIADITITAGSWRPGMWPAIGEKATLDAFTGTTKNNASGPLITEGLTAATRKVRVSYSGGTLANEVAAGDVLYFEGAWDGVTYNEMPGLIIQGSNTTGTSLGLSANTYQAWKGNTYDVAGEITSDVVQSMMSGLRDRGAESRLTGYFGNKAYSALIAEANAMRVIDSSYNSSKAKLGYKSIAYETPELGEIEIVNHPFMAESEALFVDDGDVLRTGSSDITFGIPGTKVDCPIFERVPGYTAAELILFTDQCCMLKTPSRALFASGITFGA